MPQISIQKGRVAVIGQPPTGVNVNVKKDYVDFEAWGEGIDLVVRLSRAEIDAYAKQIGAALSSGASAPLIVLPGRA